MTIARMVSLFKLIEDKIDGLYFTDDEILEFLNTAQSAYVESMVFNDNSSTKDGAVNEKLIEVKEQGSLLLERLMIRDLAVAYVKGGAISSDIIESLISAKTGGTNEKLLYVSSLRIKKLEALGGGYSKAKFVRYNDFDMFQENTYKKASLDNIQYTYGWDGIKIYPDESYLEVNINALKRPLDMSLIDSIDSEVNEAGHLKIVALALSMAKVPIENDDLNQFYAVVNN